VKSSRRTPRRPPPANKTSTTDASTAERDARIWDLRLLGLSLRRIGDQVGLSHPAVKDVLDRGYAGLIYPKVDEARGVELERLDLLLSKLAPAIVRGDVPAILAALKVSDRRAKLLGLDAPTRVQAELEDVTPPRPELLDRIAAVEAANAVRQAALRERRP
jgi:hypothetical protein